MSLYCICWTSRIGHVLSTVHVMHDLLFFVRKAKAAQYQAEYLFWCMSPLSWPPSPSAVAVLFPVLVSAVTSFSVSGAGYCDVCREASAQRRLTHLLRDCPVSLPRENSLGLTSGEVSERLEGHTFIFDFEMELSRCLFSKNTWLMAFCVHTEGHWA